MFDLRKLRNLDRDDLLNLIGLETRRTASDWILPTVGIFGAGLLVGFGLGLLVAPKPGHELREDLRNRLQGGMEELGYAQAESSSGSNQQPARQPSSRPTY